MSFTLRAGELWARWDDGRMTYSGPRLAEAVREVVALGRTYDVTVTGPSVAAGTRDPWAAWLTVYDTFDLVYGVDETEVEVEGDRPEPPEVPAGAVP